MPAKAKKTTAEKETKVVAPAKEATKKVAPKKEVAPVVAEKIEKVEKVEKKASKKVMVKKDKKTESAKSESVAVEKNSAEEVKKAARSKRYLRHRAMVDRTKFYPALEGIALAKKAHFGRAKGGSLEVHLVLKGESLNVDVAFPFSAGRKVTVAIANEETMAKIEKENIDFDVLIAHPSMMPKLAKFARILGPKGLMPNPKSGTLSTDPEKRKKELESGSTTVKSERKAPLAHVILGKLAQPDKELGANLEALLKAFPPGKVLKCVVSASMGPGVKIQL